MEISILPADPIPQREELMQPNKTSLSTNFLGNMRTRANDFRSHIMEQTNGVNFSRKFHLESQVFSLFRWFI